MSIERLTRDLELQDGGGVAYTSQDVLYTVVVQGEDLRAALARVAELEAALEPFATAFDLNSTDGPCLTKADVVAMHNWIDVQSFRRASQTLARKAPSGDRPCP